MSAQLKNYGLEGARLNIIQGDSPDLSELKNGLPSMSDIYEFARTSLTSQQQTIDSLRSVIAFARINDTIAGRIAPEIKVVFPQVEEIAVSRAVFGNVSTEKLDTVSMALVKYSRPMTADRQREFENYLKARLNDRKITLVNIGNQIDFQSVRSGKDAGKEATTAKKK